MFKIIDQGVLSHDPNTGAFIPTIIPLADGTFIAAQQVGAALASRDHRIEILRSENGREWRRQGALDLDGGTDEWSYHSAQIWEMPDRRLMLRTSRFWHCNNPRQFEKRQAGDDDDQRPRKARQADPGKLTRQEQHAHRHQD